MMIFNGSKTVATTIAALSFIIVATPAASGEFKLDFKGSLAPGKHTRYVPPLANPLLNETPYITTEMRPLLLYNDIPDSFLTGGGTIIIGAVLPDEDGFVNISAGLKYAIHSDPVLTY